MLMTVSSDFVRNRAKLAKSPQTWKWVGSTYVGWAGLGWVRNFFCLWRVGFAKKISQNETFRLLGVQINYRRSH